jgi:hypothetical protein
VLAARLSFLRFLTANPAMKKIRQRRGMVALAILGLYVIWMGCCCGWRGFTHHGNGTWTFGGSAPEASGAPDTDEYKDVLSESEYKRQSYLTAGIFFFFGGWMLRHSIGKWRERTKLEKAWQKTITHNLDDIHRNPAMYRDDFKQWIKETHPHLSIWTLPPNSSN